MTADLPPKATPAGERLPMRRPLLPVTLAFILGVALGAIGELPLWPGAMLCSLAAGVALVQWRLGRAGPLRILAWMLAFLGVGMIRGPAPAPLGSALPEGAVAAVIEAESGWRQAVLRRSLDGNMIGVLTPSGQALPLSGRITLSVLEDDSAGACPVVLPGQRLRAMVKLRPPGHRRNPGLPDPADLQERRGLRLTGLAASCDQVLVEAHPPAPSLMALAERGRLALRQAIAARPASRDARAVLTALTIGDAGGVAPDLREHFSRSGLAHLLAVSGLHLGFVALGLYALLVWIGRRIGPLALALDVRRLAALTLIPVTIGYAALAGARLPTLRAAVVVICFLVAALLRRKSDPVQTLAAAALVVLGLWPSALFEASFQLSFAAAGAVLLLTPRLCALFRVPWRSEAMPRGMLRRIGVRALQLGLVSLAAVLGTAPLTAWHFNQAGLGGLVANLLAVPLAAWLIVPLGLLAAVGLCISATLGGWILDLALWLCDGLVGLAQTVSALPGAHWAVAAPSPLQLAAWYGGLLIALFWRGERKRLLVAALAILFVGSWAMGRLAPLWSDDLRVTILDVGQGESVLVQLPGGDNLLIDGGPARPGGYDSGRRVIAPVLWNLGVHRLKKVILSHGHPDHMGGLPAIVELFAPEEVISPAPLAEFEDAGPLLRAVREAGARERVVGAGEILLQRHDVRLTVLWPRLPAHDLAENERSLVLRLEHGRIAFLLTGDLERGGEQGLLDLAPTLSADLLKVGHHGSRGATSERFIQAVRPSEAVISVGAHNPYGLPHADTLARLARAGARTWRTDVHGALTAISDGSKLDLRSVVGDQKRPTRPKAAPSAALSPSGE